jgi:hypothetical protein
VEILEKIEGRYSDEAVAQRETWHDSYTPEMAERMRIAAAYYASNPPYYADLARSVLADPTGFVPSEKQYRAITENKYALKVLDAHFSEPKFPVGAKIMGRSTGGPMRGKMGFVMKTDAKPVVNAARGTKVYMVLPVGEAVPVFVEERHLKRGRF